jgi:hypothetical protein
MGILDRFKRVKNIQVIDGSYDIESIGNIVVPEKLTDSNAFTLANSVAELDFPIDFYADRISKIRRYIADAKTGEEIENTELLRFIQDGINPFYSFSDLVYQYVYSLLAYGNALNYMTVPSSYVNISVNNIHRWDVLNPDLTEIEEYSKANILQLSDKRDIIKKATYGTLTGKEVVLNTRNLIIDNYNLRKQEGSLILSKSPLFSRNKSIDLLLAVYSARYNVYANNGAAGYLAKKSLSANQGSLENIFDSTNHRDKILADINERNGLTGKKNIWGISGVPIEFVKTLATISELMPLEETLECAIKIASAYQIPAVLVPKKDESTFDNQENAERNVWENGIMSLDQTVNENLSRNFALTKIGYKIMSDYSTVSCLQQNESIHEDLKAKKIANLKALKEIAPEIDITEDINEIINKDGK